jgi:hypothetical protein
MTESMTTADVDLAANVHADFPRGWNSAVDFMEAFLLAAALEMQERRTVNRLDPFAAGVLDRLSPNYRYDTFGSLLRHGVHSDAEWNRPAVSMTPEVYARTMAMIGSGERIGRLPLLGLVWALVAEILDANQHLRVRGTDGYNKVLGSLNGMVLNPHGTTLFLAALYREWHVPDKPSELTDVEKAFVLGQSIPGTGAGTLAASGPLYIDSIWATAFRLVERRSPEHYIRLLRHRQISVNDLLSRGARLAEHRAKNCWPGWSSLSEIG